MSNNLLFTIWFASLCNGSPNHNKPNTSLLSYRVYLAPHRRSGATEKCASSVCFDLIQLYESIYFITQERRVAESR